MSATNPVQPMDAQLNHHTALNEVVLSIAENIGWKGNGM